MDKDLEILNLRRQVVELQGQILHMQHERLTAEIQRVESLKNEQDAKNEQNQG